MIKLLHRFLALLLSTALVLTAAVWIFSHTLGSPTYLEQHADTQNIYQKLVDQMPGGTSVGLLRSQIQDFLPKMYTAISGVNPGADITLPGSDKPITPVAPGSLLATIVQISSQLTWLGPTVSVILIIFILAVGGAARWKILSNGFFSAAIGLAVTAGVLWLSPGFVISNLITAGLTGLRAALEPFIIILMHDIAWQFLLAAGGALAFAVILRVAHIFAGLSHRFRKPKPQRAAPESDFPGRLQD